MKIHVDYKESGNTLHVKVTNICERIESKDLDKIFKMFCKIKPESKRVGMGLFYCMQICKSILKDASLSYTKHEKNFACDKLAFSFHVRVLNPASEI